MSIYFNYYLPLEMDMALHLNKFKFPSPKDALCQVWLKLAQWFLRRRFLKFVNVFLLFLLSPLGEVRSPSFEETWIPFTQGYFVPSFRWNWPSGSWEEDENVKSLQTDGLTTDNSDQKSSLELSARWAKNQKENWG